MEKIEGLVIPKLTFKPKKLGDLLYHDGPLLSHFTDEDRPAENYLYRWVDNDENYNRWLIFKISTEDLTTFFEQKVSLRTLIEDSQFIFLLNLDNELNAASVLLTTIPNLPDSYLPAASSTFKPQFYDKYALQLKEKLLNNRYEQNMFKELLTKVEELEKQQNLILTTLTDFFKTGKLVQSKHS